MSGTGYGAAALSRQRPRRPRRGPGGSRRGRRQRPRDPDAGPEAPDRITANGSAHPGHGT